MERVSLDSVVGFVLAILFAIVIGGSMEAVVIGDYMNTNVVMSEQSQHTLRILGLAGGLAALVSWWMQGFVAPRAFIVRFLFSLFVFVVAFCAFGGMLRVIYSQISRPNLLEWSLSDYYWNPLSDLYTFILFLLTTRPVYAAVMVVAAIYLAIFGPRVVPR